MSPSPASPRRVLTAVFLAAVALVVLLATSRDYAMVWDEGHTIRRERTLLKWFALVAEGGSSREEAFTAKSLAAFWPFSRAEPNGHPPFYALLGLAGWWVSHRWVDPLSAYRFGPMILASATVGIVFHHMAGRRGGFTGLVAAGSLAFTPQVFSLAHYAHYDMPVACLWLLAQIAFLNGVRSRLWGVPFGVFLGLAAGTKFTGVFAVVAPFVWTLLFEWLPRLHFSHSPANPAKARASGAAAFAGTRTLLLGGLVAALTLYAIQPAWWSEPFEGLIRYVGSNLSRDATKPIPTMYLGRFYAFSLPWHNTIVLTAVSIPVGILALAFTGISSVLLTRPLDRDGVLWVLSWLTLMIVRALPNAPGHDGVRLFLPSVVSLAMLAGIGFQAWQRWLSLPQISCRWLPQVFAAMALGGGFLGIIQLYPYTLSYYNAALGGLKGAERHGFELTYYWDTMGPEFFEWLRNERLKRPLEIRFPADLVNIAYLREWKMLPDNVPILRFDPGTSQEDYVLQRRRGHFYPYDWWLENHGQAEFTISRQGVDLLRVYTHAESLKAYESTRNVPIPQHLKN